METLEFSSPQRAKATRKPPVTVHLCGHDITFHEPKQTVKCFAGNLIADEVSEADRAMALLQFINGSLDGAEQKTFTDRATNRDDPLGRAAVLELVATLLNRWSDEPTEQAAGATLTIDGPEGGPEFYGDEPVRLHNPDLDLDLVAYPPKDLALMLVASGMATGSTLGQQAWSVGVFLDSCLEPPARLLLNHRMRDRNDPIEITDVTDVVVQLLERWAPEHAPTAGGNRAARRAAARKK